VPGDVILKTFGLVRAMREAGIPVIGGFHTSMERECLGILLRGSRPIVICPARGLERMRPSREVRDGIQAGRVLLVSLFGPRHRRATTGWAEKRNRLVAALASWAFVSHAAPGGKTETLCREVLAMRKPIFTVDSPENNNASTAIRWISRLTPRSVLTSRSPLQGLDEESMK
jgi:predicted Rossmann fold nucleotide-binding protein DprA/Smf involved in DNA uptake